MLEQTSVLLRNGSPAGTRSADRAGPAALWAGRRSIVDPATGQFLGAAWWQPESGLGWSRWFTRPVLTVCESVDESLVFTVHRAGILSPYWEVRDSEGSRVGAFHGYVLWNRNGRRLTDGAARDEEAGRRIRSVTGNEWAAVRLEEGGIRLTLADEVKDEPFLKMLLLASVLVGESRHAFSATS